MELSYCEMREKTVVNIIDGKDLGHVQDITFSEAGKISGFTVKGDKVGFWGAFRREEIFIPWRKICKIGSDVVLIELCDDEEMGESHNISQK